MTLPTPHGEKLTALLRNPKLPSSDRPKVEEAVEKYNAWKESLSSFNAEGEELLSKFLDTTNEYKKFIEFDLIFLSNEDFLYRQKGQLKLDNTVLEEFLPYLIDDRLVPGLRDVGGVVTGPQKCFSRLHFGSIYHELSSNGIFIKLKDQDFTVSKCYSLTITDKLNSENSYASDINVAYFVSEIKTNLDKTMFQEAAATARELKSSVNTAKYVLLCEFLDMPPIDTRTTYIDEVIVLRKAKRLNSNVRSSFSNSASRLQQRDFFERYISENPLATDTFARLLYNLNDSFPVVSNIDEGAVLDKGYF